MNSGAGSGWSRSDGFYDGPHPGPATWRRPPHSGWGQLYPRGAASPHRGVVVALCDRDRQTWRRPSRRGGCTGSAARGTLAVSWPYDWLVGGAAEAGESYRDAAARELAEELGVFGAVHEVVVTAALVPDPGEIARHGGSARASCRRRRAGGVRVRRGGSSSA
ncbi:NUDIX domain-containing protein [Streptomyces sp. NPDC048523]|uniref:NUDIX domain-containing protein n=1 Tax=Streptomyces sp. NPDC048523 TaxID=3365567 RepID=UPI0037216F5A